MKAIETKQLTKKFKTKTAVDAIDLSVEEGELFALLGVNGAGKTTTIRMLTCLSVPTSGEAYVKGHSVTGDKAEIKRIIGISPQDTAVADNLTIRENLEFMAKVYGFDKEKSEKRVKDMIEMFGFGEVENSRAKTLSGGWKRKLSIAMAIIGEPELLFLDEPTLGLDVLARRELWRSIKKLKGRITIVLTTHYMEEAEELSDRIGIMKDGHLLAVGTADALKQKAGKEKFEEAFIAIVKGGSK